MQNKVRSTKLVHSNNQGPRGYRLSGLAIALAACGLLSGTASEATVFVGVPGTTYTGTAPSTPGFDEYDFSGLTLGAPYDLPVTDTGGGPGGVALVANLYHDSVLPADLIGSATLFSPDFHDFTGLLTSTELILTLDSGGPCCEGYGLHLTTRTSNGTAPEPASVALVAAGLVGAFVARRRKRA